VVSSVASSSDKAAARPAARGNDASVLKLLNRGCDGAYNTGTPIIGPAAIGYVSERGLPCGAVAPLARPTRSADCPRPLQGLAVDGMAVTRLQLPAAVRGGRFGRTAAAAAAARRQSRADATGDCQTLGDGPKRRRGLASNPAAAATGEGASPRRSSASGPSSKCRGRGREPRTRSRPSRPSARSGLGTPLPPPGQHGLLALVPVPPREAVRHGRGPGVRVGHQGRRSSPGGSQ
jgi:hypothetical protein